MTARFLSLPRMALAGACLALCASASANTFKSAPTPPPAAASRFESPGAYHAGLIKAVKNANGTVDSEFIATWFGATTLAEEKTPMLQVADGKGSHTIAFAKAGDVWQKIITPIPALAPVEAIASSGPRRRAHRLPPPREVLAPSSQRPTPVLQGSVAEYPPRPATSATPAPAKPAR